MLIVRDSSKRFQEILGMPINSDAMKKKLKAAGIDTNSKQYQLCLCGLRGCRGGSERERSEGRCLAKKVS